MQLAVTENYQPTPHMSLELEGIPEGAATVTIYRDMFQMKSPTSAVVRGIDRAPLYGSQAFYADWDCPLQTMEEWGQYKYVAQVFNAQGVQLASAKAYASFPPMIDDDYAWITNPYRPTQGLYVALMQGTDETTEYPSDVALSVPGWSTGLPSAAVSRRRRGGHRTLVVRLGNLIQADLLEELVLDAPVLVLRAPNMRHPHGTMFLTPTSISEHRERDFMDTRTYLDGDTPAVDGPDDYDTEYAPAESVLGEETTWTIECDEIDGTRIPIVVNPWTYHNTKLAAATYRDRAAKYPAYVDANRGDL